MVGLDSQSPRGRPGPDCDTLVEWTRDEGYPVEVSSWQMEKYLANPSLRTSVGSDWGHLTVRTRLEPASCRYLCIPATPDPWLVLTTGGGPRKTEVRRRNGWSCAFSGPGNLALTSPGKSTEIRWDRGDGSGIETIHVCIDAALLSVRGENFECDPARVEVIDGFAEHDLSTYSIVSSLGDELRNPERAGRLFLDSAAQMLVAQLLRKYCAFPLALPNQQARLSARRLRLVEDYIQAGLASRLTLEDLAASIHMSAYHFARMFKATTGQTPHAVCDPPAYRASPGTPSNIPLLYAGHCATSGVRQQKSFCRDVSQVDRYIASSVPKRNLE